MSNPEDFNQYVLSQGNGKYSCSMCDFTQSRPSHVRNHVESIHFPHTFTYNCPVCGKDFGTKKAFLNHKKKCQAL